MSCHLFVSRAFVPRSQPPPSSSSSSSFIMSAKRYHQILARVHDSKRRSFQSVTTMRGFFRVPSASLLLLPRSRCISDSSQGEILPRQRSRRCYSSFPSLPLFLNGAILVGDQATPPRRTAPRHVCVRFMRWFSLIDQINLRDAYDPLRSTILILTFISDTHSVCVRNSL